GSNFLISKSNPEVSLITSVVPLEFSRRKSDSWAGGGFEGKPERKMNKTTSSQGRRRKTTRTSVNLGCLVRRRWLSSGSGSEEEVKGKRIAAVWGNGDYGRLGLGSLDSQWKPAPLLLEAIACGGAHTLFLTRTGRLYATGLNDFGQLGVHDDIAYTNKPIEVSGIDKEIVQISAGYHHSCAITAEGELYMWGKNSNGQLGLGKRAAKVVSLPTKVECLAGITMKMAALGSEHSVAVADGGESLSWGGGSGRLGHGHESGILGIFKSTSNKNYVKGSIRSKDRNLCCTNFMQGSRAELLSSGCNSAKLL
ncbi:Regulator of chromosome condensation family protein, partial [Prunus dulcis]